MTDTGEGPLLTLEPLLEAVRLGVEDVGWTLSGIQKTTSHEFDGRWKGESTRSAYLFFHRPGVDERVSIDVFLDETSEDLSGNLALALAGSPLGDLEPVTGALERLVRAMAAELVAGHRTPVTLRATVEDPSDPPGEAGTECRFKLMIPEVAIQAGARVVRTLAAATATSFEALLESRVVTDFLGAPDFQA